jgi:hypothetical protein
MRQTPYTAEEKERLAEYRRRWREANPGHHKRTSQYRERQEGVCRTNHSVERGVARQADYEARLREMPADTRTITQRVFGDPLPNDPRRGKYG